MPVPGRIKIGTPQFLVWRQIGFPWLSPFKIDHFLPELSSSRFFCSLSPVLCLFPIIA